MKYIFPDSAPVVDGRPLQRVVVVKKDHGNNLLSRSRNVFKRLFGGRERTEAVMFNDGGQYYIVYENDSYQLIWAEDDRNYTVGIRARSGRMASEFDDVAAQYLDYLNDYYPRFAEVVSSTEERPYVRVLSAK